MTFSKYTNSRKKILPCHVCPVGRANLRNVSSSSLNTQFVWFGRLWNLYLKRSDELILGPRPGSRSQLQAHNGGWHSDHKTYRKNVFIEKEFRVAISAHTIWDSLLLQEFALSKYWFIVDLCWLQVDPNQRFKWSPPTQFYNQRNVSIKLISRLIPLLILAWKFCEFYLFFSRFKETSVILCMISSAAIQPDFTQHLEFRRSIVAINWGRESPI